MLAVETDIDGAKKLSERIREEIDQFGFEIIGKISISIGVTAYVPKETDLSFLYRADKALYAAKSGSKNRVISIPSAKDATLLKKTPTRPSAPQ